MAAQQFFLPFPTAFSSNGLPAGGARVYFFESGTLIPVETYTTDDLDVPHEHPIEADASGHLPPIYLDSADSPLRLRITDRDGVQLGDDIDPFIPGTVPGAELLEPYVTLAQDAATQAADASADALAALQALQVATGEDILGTLPLQAVSRAAMAAFTGMSTGDQAFLGEAGREGVFEFSAANNSANVTADPYQGLYVPPASDTDGSSGAWVRVVEGPIYQASWWGITTAIVNVTPLMLSAINLLPTGGILELGEGDYDQTTSLTITRSDFKIRGQGMGVTALIMDAGAGPIGNIGFSAPTNVEISHLRLHTNSVHLGPNNNPNLGFGAPNGAAAPTHSNAVVHDVHFTGGAIGVIFSGSDDNDETLGLLEKPSVYNCVFENDTMGISVVACKDAYVGPNLVRMTAETPNGAGCVVRVWGSDDTTIEGIRGNSNGEYGIWISTMDRVTGTGSIRRANTNVTVRDCHITEARVTGLSVSECQGDLTVDGCFFKGTDFDEDEEVYGCDFNGQFAAISGLIPRCDRVSIINTIFHGYGVMIREAMAIRSLRWIGCQAVGNSHSEAYPDGKLCGSFAGGISLCEIKNSSFLMMTQTAGANFRVVVGTASTRLRVTYCDLPETAPGSVIADVTGNMGEKISTGNIHYTSGSFAQFIA